jgi:hypothetical protein
MRGVKGTGTPYGYSCQHTEMVEGELVECGRLAHKQLDGHWTCQKHKQILTSRLKRKSVALVRMAFTLQS